MGQEEALATPHDCPSLWESTLLLSCNACPVAGQHVYPFEDEVNLVLIRLAQIVNLASNLIGMVGR